MALWARVVSAEKEHEAAKARLKGLPVPFLRPDAEYDEGEQSERDAWVDAEGARHDLDAFLHSRRYYPKGVNGRGP